MVYARFLGQIGTRPSSVTMPAMLGLSSTHGHYKQHRYCVIPIKLNMFGGQVGGSNLLVGDDALWMYIGNVCLPSWRIDERMAKSVWLSYADIPTDPTSIWPRTTGLLLYHEHSRCTGDYSYQNSYSYCKRATYLSGKEGHAGCLIARRHQNNHP